MSDIKNPQQVGLVQTCRGSHTHSVVNQRTNEGKIYLDVNYWDYSTTTGKYRNIFLNENKSLTQKKINSNVYLLVDLNN